jgi:hypothetical protein
MGTRCLTIVEDEDGKELVTLYRQFDGYPDGHGAELKSFLKGFKIVNGIGARNAPKTANGAGCFAAQLVAHFKRKSRLGGFYLYPAGTRDVGEEYTYRVRVYSPSVIPLGQPQIVLTVSADGVESTI